MGYRYSLCGFLWVQSGLNKFTWLYGSLRQDIDAGIWLPGERLPSIRSLVVSKQVSKNTVLRALAELESSGYLYAKPRQGFFVTERKTQPATASFRQTKLQASEVSLPAVFHTIMAKGAAFDLTPEAEDKLIPTHLVELNRALGRAQKQAQSEVAFYYDAPGGDTLLKQQLRARYQHRNLAIADSDICITGGCQNALFLALSVCCEPGDTVAVESPCFYGVLQLLEQLRLQIVEIPSSAKTGMAVEQLKRALAAFPIKACVITPNFATPSGAQMQEDDKRALVALANEYEFTIVEDDIYGDLGFDQETVPLASYDTQDRVILCGSVSKSLSRDLRVGWVISRRWQSELLRLKLASQLAGSRVTQRALANFIRNGDYRRHLLRFKRSLQMQRNQLLSAMKSYWPKQAQYQVPHGGLALWVVLPQECDTNDLYQAMLPQGIILTPGSLFSSQGAFHHCLRLSFNQPYVGRRLTAIKTLGHVLNTKISC